MDGTHFSVTRCVAVIVGVLMVVCILVLPTPMALGGSKVSKAQAELTTLGSAIDQFRLDCDRYPTEAEGLTALLAAPKGVTGWNGPYLPGSIPMDPWGNPYHYTDSGPLIENGFELKSFGADGKPGGSGENADIEAGTE